MINQQRIQSLLLCLLLLFSVILADMCSVLHVNSQFRVLCSSSTSDEKGNIVATAKYEDRVEQQGWGHFTVRTYNPFNPNDQAYAAGLLEGFMTSERISQMYLNFYGLNFPNGTSNELLTYYTEQINWIKASIEANSDDQYWNKVELVVRQVEGILQGLHDAGVNNLTFFDLFLLNSDGDLEDLTYIFPPKKENADLIIDDQFLTYSSCSALIKVLSNRDGSISDILAGHATWSKFGSMLRIYKHYIFEFGLRMSFSSRPGFVSSKDDFYVINNNFVVMETTNDIFNQTLFDEFITPKSLPTWIRSLIANNLAKNGKSWTREFVKFNSGTYNNQWMILDLSRMKNNQSRNLLWIIEQIPGEYVAQDVSSVLFQQGYWASYNVPYSKKIFNNSGYANISANFPMKFSYTNCSRAQIFKRDQGSVKDMDSLKRLMRYNQWKTDVLSQGNPALSIASRYDLLDEEKSGKYHPIAFGAIDSKVTSLKYLVPLQKALAVSGPTHDDQPIFAWSESRDKFPNIPHYGHPDGFNFDYVDTVPFDFGKEMDPNIQSGTSSKKIANFISSQTKLKTVTNNSSASLNSIKVTK